MLFIAALVIVFRRIERSKNNTHQQSTTYHGYSNGNGSAPSPTETPVTASVELPVTTGNIGIINTYQEESDVPLPPPTAPVEPDIPVVPIEPDIHVTSDIPSFPVISAVTVNETMDETRSAAERLQELENIRKFITEEEYNTKKQKILDDL